MVEIQLVGLYMFLNLKYDLTGASAKQLIDIPEETTAKNNN